MVVNMARRKRIIKLSKGKTSITKFRQQERTRGRGGEAKAAVTTPTKHVPTKRTPEQLKKLSPAQRLYAETGTVASSVEGAKKQLLTLQEKKKEVKAKEPLRPEGATPEEIAAQQSLVRPEPEFDPAAKELALYGTKRSQQLKAAAFVAAGATVAVVAGVSAMAIGKIEQSIHQKTVSKLSALTGKDVANIIAKAAPGHKRAAIYKKVLKLTPKQIWKAFKYLGAGIIGVNGIMAWYSLDNVIGGTKFFSRDLAEGVEFGTIDPIEAKESLETSLEARDAAVSLIEISSKYNPILWPFRNLMLTGMAGDNEAIQVNVERISAAAATSETTGGVEGEPLWEEKWD